MKSLCKLITILYSFAVLATSPTEEGLFRNGDNPEIKGNLIAYRIHLHYEKITEPEEVPPQVEDKKIQETPKQTAIKEPEKTEVDNYVKVIITNHGNNYLQYLFLYYDKPDFNKDHLIHIRLVQNTRQLLDPQKSSEFSRITIGLLQMFTLNRSDEIVPSIKAIEPEFKLNKEIINKEKEALYTRYKNYLKQIKENPELKETLENPRSPEDPEKKLSVNKLISQPMYQPSSSIKLTKLDNKYLWTLTLPNLQATFTQQHLFLKSMIMRGQHSYQIDVEDFVLFDNIHLLPPTFMIRRNDNETLQISFKKFTIYPNAKTVFKDRVEYYTKILKKNRESGFINETAFIDLLNLP